ncbi:hypothetical protein [Lactobacillus helveticus]|uniref:hypothetical protein n=1 Tax=Lactobacillus helveticus TaxID=1587 RepID=UPI00197BF442|nr:hypothetical protein [Lactobacillus helveticus]MBN6050203.1 hypothetical protein [Lactobacillus helveticus]
MKRKTILMCSALLALAGLMTSTHVKADDLPERMNPNNTVSITRKVFVYNHKQSAEVNAKLKALIDAQNALSELKGKIKGNELAVGGASGFFKEIAENTNMSEDQKNDARAAYMIVNGELDAPSWYDKDVNLGQANDATSVKNFYATLPYYDQYVKIRQKYNLSVPKVSLADVAVAMMDADYSTHVVDHARHYNASENLAWNYADDPNGIWMGEESIWNKAVKKNPSLAQYKNLGYGLLYLQVDSELFEQVGHYLNLIDPSTSSYGYALNTESNDYDNTESWDSGYGDPVFSVDEFKKLVTDYYNKMELPDQVKAAKAKVNKAKKDLANAKKAAKKSKKKAKKHVKKHVKHARKVKRTHHKR